MHRDFVNGLFGPSEHDNRYYGVTVGVVTNNKDPEKLGRVKVKLPWLSDQDESHWARLVTPMAGAQRGIFFLPEVNDEVLVAFEHGIVEYPYIIGALWNGKDKPPETNADGKNNLRLVKSRSGHLIRLDDTQGKEKIEVIDKSGKNSIVIDTSQNSITITSEGTLALKAKQDISIESSNGKVTISGQGVQIDSKAEVKVTSSSNTDVTASGSANVKASGQLNLKGSMVNIN